MSLQEKEIELTALAAEFMGQFHGRHLILFAGAETTREVISALSACPWSCIFTSRTDSSFGESFAVNGRTVKEYCPSDNIPVRPLNTQGELPVLRIFGLEGNDEKDIQEELELTGQTVEDYRNTQAVKILNLLLGMFDGASIMVVVGYSPETANELPYRLFATTLNDDNIPSGCVQFWGLNEEDPKIKILKRLAEKKDFDWQSTPLDKLLDGWNIEEESEENKESYNDLNQIFYKGKKQEIISTQDLLRYSHVGQLVTDQAVYAVRPYGRILQARWYYNFLTRSSKEGPQWYGYLRNSEFYLRREYENSFVQLVRNQLNSATAEEAGIPIILYGDPGSSKSVTLGALAYRVFNEKINPVIFIKNDTLVFSNDSLAGIELCDFMAKIEGVGSDTRILVIWDCSSYRNITKNALRLSKMLKDRGRRFVLVCTAYNDILDLDKCAENISYKKYVRTADGSEVQREATREDYDYCFAHNCYFVHSERRLTQREEVKLWGKIAEFSGISPETLQKKRKYLENSNQQDAKDIFYCYYNVISMLRPNLERALTREEKVVNEYVKRQLSIFEPVHEREQQYGPLYYAFKKAGYSMDEWNHRSPKKEEPAAEDTEKDFGENLFRFNKCIALFGRFKLEVPYSLAVQVFLGKGAALSYSDMYNPQLYNALTTQIPWIHYAQGKEGGDYVFSYRNAFEAELFLGRNNVGGEEQVDLVCDMLNLYGKYYQEKKYLMDSYLGKSLQQLIRLMGPNSQYPGFRIGTGGSVWTEILRHMDKIINALHDLCDKYKIPDNDAGFATLLITFTREYYGNKWERLNAIAGQTSTNCTTEVCKNRIDKIAEISAYADKWIKRLEDAIYEKGPSDPETRYLTDQKNGISVEFAQCNIMIKRLQRAINGQTADEQAAENEKQEDHSVKYQALYDILYNIILANPNNGHAYNTLFSAFEEEYAYGNWSDAEKLKALTEVKLIADDCKNYDIQNRGADDYDEIQEHLNKIAMYCDNHKVSIEDIKNQNWTSAFAKLYHDMLQINSPSAIIFVCQQELKSAKIDRTTDELNDYQVMVCGRVKDFLSEEQNRPCVQSSYYALSFKLRVVWMYYTKRRLNGSKECQLVCLKSSQWKEIQEISEACVSEGQKISRVRPLEVLVSALAILEVTGNYIECLKRIKSISEDQFYYQPRMKVPFIYCNETDPVQYSGHIIDIKGNSGRIRLANVPNEICGERGIRFYARNIGKRPQEISRNQLVPGLELGIGYTGFSLYVERERKQKEAYFG